MSQSPSIPASAKPAHTIGHKTARGFFWLIGQGVGEKFITLGGQIALARLLTKDDFKLVALTYTITTFAGLLQQAGIGQVLIQRHARFHLWATTAFWMSLTIGLLAGILTALLAPAAAAFYNTPALQGLLLVAAISLPLNALITVPDAKLRAEMRFRFVAALGMAAVVGTIALSIALAALGYGAYSFILPPIAITLARAIVSWWWARPRIHLSPHFHRWKYLLSDSSMLLVGSLALMLTYQGGQIILGRLYPALAAAGVFYFAWNLSDQSMRLLATNLSGVLFPALSTMQNDPARQRTAFLRSTRTLMLLGVPVCLLQAILAGPAIRLVFSTHWNEAIPVMAALSIGLISRLILFPADSLFLAQGRYRAFMILAIIHAAAYIACVTAAAILAGPDHAATGAAIGATICTLIHGPISLRILLGAGCSREIVRIYTLPILAGIAACVPGYALTRAFPPTIPGDLGALFAAGLLSSGFYALCLWIFARADMHDILQRILAVIHRGPRQAPPP